MPSDGNEPRSKDKTSAQTHWMIPLRTMAIGGGVFGFSCLGVLVVVTAINSESALSTVALALAILAFSVQLIVFVAQQSLATEQGRRSEELYGSMQGALAELREKAAGTQADVRTINERMLEAILSKNLAGISGSDYSRIATQVAQQTARAEEDMQAPAGASLQGIVWPRRKPGPDDERYVSMLRTYPSEEEAGDAMEVLQSLSPPDQVFLRGFGRDEINARKPSSPFDPSWPLSVAGTLSSHGLVEPITDEGLPPDAPAVGHLTEKGRQVARLLTAAGEPPGYLPGLKEIRDRLGE